MARRNRNRGNNRGQSHPGESISADYTLRDLVVIAHRGDVRSKFLALQGLEILSQLGMFGANPAEAVETIQAMRAIIRMQPGVEFKCGIYFIHNLTDNHFEVGYTSNWNTLAQQIADTGDLYAFVGGLHFSNKPAKNKEKQIAAQYMNWLKKNIIRFEGGNGWFAKGSQICYLTDEDVRGLFAFFREEYAGRKYGVDVILQPVYGFTPREFQIEWEYILEEIEQPAYSGQPYRQAPPQPQPAPGQFGMNYGNGSPPRPPQGVPGYGGQSHRTTQTVPVAQPGAYGNTQYYNYNRPATNYGYNQVNTDIEEPNFGRPFINTRR